MMITSIISSGISSGISSICRKGRDQRSSVCAKAKRRRKRMGKMIEDDDGE